jgi:hypothetical protein
MMETIGQILSGLTVIGIATLIAFGRKIVGLPKEMIIVKAALFRLLRSNKLQGIAIAKIAEVQKEGTANGKTDEAVRAVTIDQVSTEAFLTKAAFAKPEKLEDLLEKEE